VIIDVPEDILVQHFTEIQDAIATGDTVSAQLKTGALASLLDKHAFSQKSPRLAAIA